MGSGKTGAFGNTYGATLDAISNFLTLASAIPGIDTAADFAAIFVDLARGDPISAGLSALGVIPYVGEAADASKLARMADKAADSAKTGKKATNFINYPKTIHSGKQGKHIIGHNNYQKGKSILTISTDEAQKLINKYTGKGQPINAYKERVNFGKNIGKYVDNKTNKSYDTTVGTIVYSKSGTHIVPAKPKNWR